MSFIDISMNHGVATLTLNREKVNALNETMIEQIESSLKILETNEAVKSIILTGQGKFFSFGFDIPEFLGYSKDSFIRYLTKFTNLYTYLFLFPKPVVTALNGHTIAGGAMLASACDYRIMVSGKARISFNEITFGATVFAGSVDMLKFCVGQRNAQSILYSGAMYSAGEAKVLGLINQISSIESLLSDARKAATEFIQKDIMAFGSIKKHLREPISKTMIEREKASVKEFADIWYSDKTWSNLQGIKIYP